MKKHFLVLLALAFIAPVLFAQSPSSKYLLQLPGGNRSYAPNFEAIRLGERPLLTADERQSGVGYRILQFEEVPGQREKAQLAELGIELRFYVRKYAWLVEIPARVQPAQLAAFPIRGIYPLDPSQKLSASLRWGDHPSHALPGGDRVEVWAFLYPRIGQEVLAQLEAHPLAQQIRALGGSLEPAFPLDAEFAPPTLAIELPIAQASALAQLPAFYYLDHSPAPPQPEREPSRHTARSNVLHTDYLGGLNLDGSGIVTAVCEGKLDPDRIDFRGRIDASYHTGTNFSNHAYGVSQHICGAGNENPLERGMAPATPHLSVNHAIWNQPSFYTTENLRLANHSYGAGCQQEYTAASVTIDNQIRNQSSMMHICSAGNSGNDLSCDSYGVPGWANLTGGHKQAKNSIASASVNDYDVRMGFSSKGPAYDGRVKPDIAATGPGGTSFASPVITGVMAQLYQGYKQLNNWQEPASGLIKGILQNTADDLGNPGPDFQYGYGRINARRAYEVIAAGHYMADSISNGDSLDISLNVPAGTKQLRAMLYWSDYEATAGAPAALVNDLDLTLSAPNSTTYLPWVLDTASNPVSLNLPATRGRDSLNNMEQVTLDNPTAGTFQAKIKGRLVPQGPQAFYLIYEFVPETLILTHPLGGETWAPGENQIIKWDAYGTVGTFSLEFSADSGQTWATIGSNLSDTLRYFDFTVPAYISGQCLVRIHQGSLSSTSQAPFSIIPIPDNLLMAWVCADSGRFTWDSVPGATGYEVYRLGAKYMTSVATVTGTSHVVHGLSTTSSNWLSVRALGDLNAAGRRAVAYESPAGNMNCIPYNASLDRIVGPGPGFLPDCFAGRPLPVSIEVSSIGVSPMMGIAASYQLGTGNVVTHTISTSLTNSQTTTYTFPDSLVLPGPGVYTLKTWVHFPGDGDQSNDTLTTTFEVYASGTVTPSYTQDFDQFSTCNTAWGCESITCTLSQDWFNVPNVPGAYHDSIDFRTHTGATGSGGTGPSADHTSGNGHYLYLEGSGNSGSGCQNHEAQLHSPCLDLRGTNQATLSFWYHMLGNAIGSLAVDVNVEGEWILDVIPPIVGDQGNNWLEQEVDLGPFAGQQVLVRFRGRTGSGWAADLAIDDVNLETLPRMDFSADRQVVCPGDTITFTDASTYTNNWLWDIQPAAFSFVNGTNATSQHPQIVVNAPGLYSVSLSGTNANGADTLVQAAYLNAGPHALTLSASDPDSSICAGDSVTFTASAAGVTQFNFFVDGTPVQSGPANTYVTTSLVDGQTISSVGDVGSNCSTNISAITFSVQDRPAAQAAADTSNCPLVAFSDLSTGDPTTNWSWDFGDNSSVSTQQNPVHDFTFAGNGTYTVTLVAGNGCGLDTASFSVTINCLVSTLAPGLSNTILVYPNPTSQRIFLEYQGDGIHAGIVEVTDLSGKVLREYRVAAASEWIKTEMDLGGLASGVYLLRLELGDERAVRKVTVQD